MVLLVKSENEGFNGCGFRRDCDLSSHHSPASTISLVYRHGVSTSVAVRAVLMPVRRRCRRDNICQQRISSTLRIQCLQSLEIFAVSSTAGLYGAVIHHAA
jgi:hypothetical protein